MMNNGKPIIADTGFIVAVANTQDQYHQLCMPLYQQLQTRIMVPQIVIVEVTQLLARHGGNLKVVEFINDLYIKTKYTVQPLEQKDFEVAGKLLQKYHDTRLDFVDASVIAMAERFNIRTVLTLDHRDFSLVKPRHCDYLTLLPELSLGS